MSDWDDVAPRKGVDLAHGHEEEGLKWRYVARYKLYGVIK